MNKINAKKGFTLIELLIVIGILAILATVTLLVLNPAQMFAQARDSQRISDLNSLKSAIALYLSTVSSPSLGTNCSTAYYGTMATSGAATATALWGTGNLHVTWTVADATSTVGTTGWAPVALGSIPGGSPISSLPVDPTNFSVSLNSNQTITSAYYYACSSTQTTFKLVGNMESQRYAKDGTDDKESTDGGINSAYYETGTNISAGL
ncbi:MAG: type II secretion system protein [Patescibacteria group bacterium]